MNDRKTLKRLCSFAGDLCDAANEEGYDSAAYKAVLEKICKTSAKIDRRQRRKEWFSHCVIFVLVIVLMWLILQISC